MTSRHDDIKSLRRCIDDLALAEAAGGSDDTPSKPKPVATFVALVALGWTAFVRSKRLGAGDDTYSSPICARAIIAAGRDTSVVFSCGRVSWFLWLMSTHPAVEHYSSLFRASQTWNL